MEFNNRIEKCTENKPKMKGDTRVIMGNGANKKM
jgi:hypothetical protein